MEFLYRKLVKKFSIQELEKMPRNPTMDVSDKDKAGREQKGSESQSSVMLMMNLDNYRVS